MNKNNKAYLGLGANLGAAQHNLKQALNDLNAQKEIYIDAVSAFYRSAPVLASGPDFINIVARISTSLSALELLDVMQKTEQQYGRTRPYPNAPRTLDIDLLLFNQEKIQHPRLIVPHPRMHERAFVLLPLTDLAPYLALEQGSLNELLDACRDQKIEKLDTDYSCFG